MHADVVSDTEGKCPKCNMDLTLSKKEQMKAEVTKLYTCPSHAEVVSNSPGTCAKCSSKLVVDRRGSKQGTIVYTCSMHPNEVRVKPGKCPECGMAMEAKTKKQ
jgi:ssDNA-binding Zn-finger/Zn-ribbon topoisomerase 1